MLDSILTTTTASTSLDFKTLLLLTAVSLLLGIGTAMVYMFRNVYTKGFVVTLATLPAMIQIVIMMVNGNLGAGIAVLGAFSLIRFRSVAGGAKEIGSIFFAMALGLTTAMGFVVYAILFFICISTAILFLTASSFGEGRSNEKELRITIPEDLDYEGIFDDLFESFTNANKLIRVRSTNMGSLYELDYHINMKRGRIEKDFIDQIRCRNGNLNISCGRITLGKDEL